MRSAWFRVQFEKTSRMSRETEDRLKAIPNFCFPDAQDWRPSADINRFDYRPSFRLRTNRVSDSCSFFMLSRTLKTSLKLGQCYLWPVPKWFVLHMTHGFNSTMKRMALNWAPQQRKDVKQLLFLFLFFIYSETFSFVLTGEDGTRWFGYCRKILVSSKHDTKSAGT